MKIIKTKMGITFILLASFLIFAPPAVSQSESAVDTAVLEQAYATYLADQERFEKIAEIEANRDAAVHELAAKWETVARERGNDETWYEKTVIGLSSLDAETLLLKTEATSWESFIGIQLKSELVLYPLPPCRILDTRNASRYGFSPIPPGGTINVDVSAPLTGQGGAINCGVISEAAAAVLNVTAVPSGGNGNLIVYPFNSPKPKASLVNYKTGVQNIANAVVQSMCRGCSDDITVASNNGTAHVVIDVIGYFGRSSKTRLDTVQLDSSWTTCPGDGSTCTVYSPYCTSGYTLTGGGPQLQASTAYINLVTSRPYGNRWGCQFKNVSGLTRNVKCWAVCARIPGR